MTQPTPESGGGMIDIGVNLLHPQFDDDREAVVTRARQAGVRHLIVTGTDLPGSRAGIAYAARAPALLSATVGIHPHDAAAAPAGWQDEVAALATERAVVAIGETGLDFNRNFSPPDVQEAVFREQLRLAASLDLPVFVHDREAGETVAACLAAAGPPPAGAIVHCFTGTRTDLLRYLELGCAIGITGWVCDRRRGAALRELVPLIPLDRLMIETDAPFLRPHNAPADAHGRRNEPALLGYVADRLAELYGIARAEVEAVTAANARRLFRLDLRGGGHRGGSRLGR
jgi:TatD DNase family protein